VDTNLLRQVQVDIARRGKDDTREEHEAGLPPKYLITGAKKMSIRKEIGLTQEKLAEFNLHNVTIVCPNCKNTGKDIKVMAWNFKQIAQIEKFRFWMTCQGCGCKFDLRKVTIPYWY